MACDNRTKVYLGYEDEYVTDKHRANINFMTNKIGGFPVSLLAFLKQIISIRVFLIESFGFQRECLIKSFESFEFFLVTFSL